MRKLGKKPARTDFRTLQIRRYIGKLAPAPDTCDLTRKITQLGMMGNDVLGDCTCATVGHMVQAWTAEDGAQVIVPDADIVAMYSAVSGYIPGNESTDNGAVVLDVLNYWRKTGLDGHTIGAYAALDARNHDQLKKAVYYFGAAYIGVELPQSAEDDLSLWDVSKDPKLQQAVGGHAIPVLAYNGKGPVVCSWGQLVQCSWAFYDRYCDEAYCCLGLDIVGSDSKSPEGFSLAQLQDDLRRITA